MYFVIKDHVMGGPMGSSISGGFKTNSQYFGKSIECNSSDTCPIGSYPGW